MLTKPEICPVNVVFNALHQVLILLWMLTSYVVDGFADLGTMFGSPMIGAKAYGQFRILVSTLHTTYLTSDLKFLTEVD